MRCSSQTLIRQHIDNLFDRAFPPTASISGYVEGSCEAIIKLPTKLFGAYRSPLKGALSALPLVLPRIIRTARRRSRAAGHLHSKGDNASVRKMREIVKTGVACLAFTGMEFVFQSKPVIRFFKNMFRKQRLKYTGQEPSEQELDKLAKKTAIKLVNEAHNLIQIPLALVVMHQPQIKDNKLYGVTPASKALNAISAGFFLQDIIQVTKNSKTAGPAMMLHAGVCCPIYVFAMKQQKASFFSAGFILWELSTPFVHAREIMHQMGMGKTKAYAVNGVAMMAVFFACRNVYGPVMLGQFWKQSRSDLLDRIDPSLRPPGRPRISKATIMSIRASGIVMTALNTLWFSKMLQGAAKLFLRRAK